MTRGVEGRVVQRSAGDRIGTQEHTSKTEPDDRPAGFGHGSGDVALGEGGDPDEPVRVGGAEVGQPVVVGPAQGDHHGVLRDGGEVQRRARIDDRDLNAVLVHLLEAALRVDKLRVPEQGVFLLGKGDVRLDAAADQPPGAALGVGDPSRRQRNPLSGQVGGPDPFRFDHVAVCVDRRQLG